ncbi:MAG: hypothetical protein HY878_04675, partial [Deltaproteobacteria bacterium]|nr:hypothetical protein [Deltaproteobacteria bacterium]
MKERFFSSLSVKIVGVVTVILAVIGGSSFIYNLYNIRKQLIEANTREALTLAQSLESTLAGMMMREAGLKPDEIQAIMLAAGERKEIKNIVVYGHDGRRAFTSHAGERGTFIKREKEEECLICHRLPPEKRP